MPSFEWLLAFLLLLRGQYLDLGEKKFASEVVKNKPGLSLWDEVVIQAVNSIRDDADSGFDFVLIGDVGLNIFLDEIGKCCIQDGVCVWIDRGQQDKRQVNGVF